MRKPLGHYPIHFDTIRHQWLEWILWLYIFDRVEDILMEDATPELFFTKYQVLGICTAQLTYNFTSLDEILDMV